VRNTDTFTVGNTCNTNSFTYSANAYAYTGNPEPNRDSGNTDTEPDDITLRHRCYVLEPSGDHHQ
jgi:hypothetical protein